MTATADSTLSFDDLPNSVGRTFGPTDWLTIEQSRIDQFAEATGDHQWIHVDPERAKEGPFGATIAHGYLTLSIVSYFASQLVVVTGMSMGINYGVDKVRFPAPVLVGSLIRARAEIMDVTPIDGGYQVKTKFTIESEGGSKPNAVIESLSRYLR
jgi:acyl dehydratase